MANPQIAAVQEWLKAHEQELLDDYRTMLRFPSIETEALPNAPFGQANRDALDFALAKAKEWGFRTKDLQGYCGYAEIGEGEGMVGVFGHLDVVPVSPGWKNQPFDADIVDGYVVARGAVDDKGPTMAAFYAARAIKEVGVQLPSRLRVVFGCDEESGFECIHKYVAEEEAPTFGIAPDAGWPLIHAEKGIINMHVTAPLPTGGFALLSIEGGSRHNIVIDACKATVRVSGECRAAVESKLADAWDRNIKSTWNGDVLEIDAIGKAAHGAWPWGGDNAAVRVFRFLMEIAPLESAEAYTSLFELTHVAGMGLGVDGRDELTSLTCNLGIVRTVGADVEFLFNLRYPVTWNGAEIKARCETELDKMGRGYKVSDFTDSKPLYFPLEHPLVKTVCEVYAAETGDTTKEPGVMGGGTYARAVPNTVAIGTGWLGDGEAHQTDEKCAIESLHKMARIYAHILIRLCEQA